MLIKNKKYLIIIGLLLSILIVIFSYLIYKDWNKDLFLNLLTEIIGIIITIFIIDYIIEKQKEIEINRIAKYSHQKIFGTISGFYFQLILLCGYPLINKEKSLKKPLRETTDKEIVSFMEDHVMSSFNQVKQDLESYLKNFNVKKLKELEELIESNDKILIQILNNEGSRLDRKIIELMLSISEHSRRIGVTYLAGFIELKCAEEKGVKLSEEMKEIINRCFSYIFNELKEMLKDFENLQSLVKKKGTVINN